MTLIIVSIEPVSSPYRPDFLTNSGPIQYNPTTRAHFIGQVPFLFSAHRLRFSLFFSLFPGIRVFSSRRSWPASARLLVAVSLCYFVFVSPIIWEARGSRKATSSILSHRVLLSSMKVFRRERVILLLVGR